MKQIRIILITVWIFSSILSAGGKVLPSQKKTIHYASGKYFDTQLAWHVLKQSFFNIKGDLYNIAAEPFRDPLKTAGYLGLVGGLVAVDKPLTNFYHQYIEDPLDIYRLPKVPLFTASYISAEESWIGLGILSHYLVGFALGDEKSQATALMAAKATIYSLGITHTLLKSLTGRNRPQPDLVHCDDTNKYRTCNPYDFQPFHSFQFTGSNRTSMPSYHLTLYFSLAKVYQEMYDNYLIPYSALALIFASHIRGHHHWVSDMVGGAIVGTLIGSQVVRNYKHERREEEGVQIIPYANGVGFQYRF